jgi:hypothetical protein
MFGCIEVLSAHDDLSWPPVEANTTLSKLDAGKRSHHKQSGQEDSCPGRLRAG